MIKHVLLYLFFNTECICSLLVLFQNSCYPIIKKYLPLDLLDPIFVQFYVNLMNS